MSLSSFKALSQLDDLASVCRRMKNLSKTLAHVEYVMVSFVYVKSTLKHAGIRRNTLAYVVVRGIRRSTLAYVVVRRAHRQILTC